MSTTTSESTIKGKFNEVAGRAKQSIGELTNNDSLANEGAAQQIKGHAQQAWGSLEEAAKDTKERHQPEAEAKAHDIREKIVSTAQNVREHVEAFAEKHKNH
ncbi:Uncharacterized conserved protein YjbJ, UPF0337 family [Bryocella elongata]|uniref:Uncharacterized conserved protein YjbJ, UPF0337 family n=1 Tax=Bryocella elongata TaxID=863522 RepID=A0A1H5W1I7_9BACT|nr:CsbD family protein [Bryocella elongata]SEF93384.1 Uncharacterized conserved protein YjbJ, UPF0337 family [Bryocella elongata]